MKNKDKKTYNRNNFINNYELTRDEIFLLPIDERMQYSQRKFGFILDSIPNKGDTTTIRGTLPYEYNFFFERHCCKVETFDCGIEETEIKRVGRFVNEYAYKDEARESLNNYIKVVASAKASVFESIIKDTYLAKIKALSCKLTMPLDTIKEEKILSEVTKNRLSDTDLPDDLKEQIIVSELGPIFTSVEEKGVAIIDSHVSKIYLDYLQSLGYDCQKNGQEIKVKNKRLAK